MNYIITNTDCFIALSTNAHTDDNIIRLEINILANMNIKSLINRQKMYISRPQLIQLDKARIFRHRIKHTVFLLKQIIWGVKFSDLSTV